LVVEFLSASEIKFISVVIWLKSETVLFAFVQDDSVQKLTKLLLLKLNGTLDRDVNFGLCGAAGCA
jgi:hypothetical protein